MSSDLAWMALFCTLASLPLLGSAAVVAALWWGGRQEWRELMLEEDSVVTAHRCDCEVCTRSRAWFGRKAV